jgi:DNA helicase MCM9
VPDASIHTDYQELKIQETSSSTSANQHSSGGSSIGQIPRSLLVKVQHDLVDSCQPGDQVVVVGSLLAQWPAGAQAQLPDAECPVDMAMMAHSVRVVDEGPTPTADASDLEQYQREFTSYWADTQSKMEPIQARNFICQAVCPKLYGMSSIKLALLITLIGGVPADAYQTSSQEETLTTDEASSSLASPLPDSLINDQPDPFVLPTSRTPSRSDVAAAAWNPASTPQSSSSSSPPPLSSHKRARRRVVQTRRRDQSHLLLVGDPGLGKSQFLKFAAAVSPRSVLTTGVGTTSAGLTCAAVREGSSKEFSLEAGALVLADKGVCCIDEFGCIQDQDRTTIHEAMEQQTLSVAKAGIVCKLNCRATVIAVMNPRGSVYDNHKSLSGNTGLGTPLLSRFDLIFKLVDTADAERDNNVTMYLLNRAIQGAGLDVSTETGTNGNAQKHSASQPWPLEKLRAYIAIVKERFQPVMSDAAARLLESHYEHCRSCQSTTIPVTVRFLESLIHLSQAHARLMFRNQVTIQDAVVVIQLMQCSAFAYGGFDGGVGGGNYTMMGSQLMYCDPMTVDFSDEADADFAFFEYHLLSHYNMLEYMPTERRALANKFMTVGVKNPVATSWDECEDIREKRF